MALRILTGLLAALVALGAIAGAALAQEGVGVNVGRIEVDEPIAPGGTYRLPSIGVINTGHDPGTYSLRITYLSGQPEMEPAKEWFRFSPDLFRLEPDEAHSVTVSIRLPLTARPGDYFAFIEAFPVRDVEEGGGVAIGIAAATRLSFTVEQSNAFNASALWVYHRFQDTSPFSYIGIGLAAAALAAFLLFRVGGVRIRIRVERGERE